MPIKTSITTKGGDKLKAILAKAEQARRSKAKVGFIGGQYPSGESLAAVAAAQNYGVPEQGIPERPFFGQAVSVMRQDLPRILARTVDPATLTVSEKEGRIIGRWAVNVIQDRIADLSQPPNAPSTLKEKKGDSPLVDTGRLSAGVTYELE